MQAVFCKIPLSNLRVVRGWRELDSPRTRWCHSWWEIVGTRIVSCRYNLTCLQVPQGECMAWYVCLRLLIYDFRTPIFRGFFTLLSERLAPLDITEASWCRGAGGSGTAVVDISNHFSIWHFVSHSFSSVVFRQYFLPFLGRFMNFILIDWYFQIHL